MSGVGLKVLSGEGQSLIIKNPSAAGFEPARAMPIRFQV